MSKIWMSNKTVGQNYLFSSVWWRFKSLKKKKQLGLISCNLLCSSIFPYCLALILYTFSCMIFVICTGNFNLVMLPASVARLDARPTGDQEVAGSTPAEVGNILSWRLIMKYFLRSFSPFRWFKKGSCQFLAKECAQYWLTAWRTKPAQ